MHKIWLKLGDCFLRMYLPLHDLSTPVSSQKLENSTKHCKDGQ